MVTENMGINTPLNKCFSCFLLLILILFSHDSIVVGQQLNQKEVLFQSYGIGEGLSQNSVNVVFQDKFGYIWIGTQAGIDRYDGYSFLNYENENISQNGPNIVWCHAITADNNNFMWFGDQLGNLSRFNPFKNSWLNVDAVQDSTLTGVALPDQAYRITSILPSEDSTLIYYGTNAVGLYSLNVQSGKKTRVLLQGDLTIQPTINELVLVANQQILIATDNGLWTFEIDTKLIKKLPLPKEVQNSVIKDIYHESADKFLLATANGLYEFELTTNKLTTILSDEVLRKEFGGSSLTAVHKHSSTNNLWMSVENLGLAVYDTKTKEIRSFTVDNSSEIGVTSNIFYKMIEDQQGILWFASYTQGLLKYDPLAQRVLRYTNSPSSPIKLGYDIVWGVHIDKQNHIWVGNIDPGGGVHILDPKNGTNRDFLYGSSSLGSRFWAFAEDAIGTMFVYHNEGNAVKVYQKAPNDNAVEFIGLSSSLGDKLAFSARAATYLTQNGELLICGINEVIQISNRDGEPTFTSYSKLNDQLDTKILDFYSVSDKTYVLTQNQLYLWDEQTNQLSPLLADSLAIDFIEAGASNDIHFVVLDDKELYIPTYGKGLFFLDLQSNTKKYYTGIDGLQNRYLYNAYVDEDQNLWMSSNLGIIHFKRSEGRFIAYGPYEGAQNYEFNANSSYQSSDGTIALGGISGLNVFNPKEVTAQSDAPNVLIQQLILSDKTLSYEQDGSAISQQFSFPYEYNSIGFDYVAFNYRNTDQNSYAYQLEGYDRDRIAAGDRQFVNYTNLKEGEYTFRVFASNHQGMWNDTGALVSFTILPPWYRTWLAYISYVLFFGVSVFVYNRFRVKQERKKAEDNRKQEELAAARDFQLRMLPEKMPNRKGLDIAAKQITSAEVGGDYYDFFETDKEHITVVCGDATGHGTASGMMVSVTKSALQALEGGSPEVVMGELNRVVKSMNLGTLRMSLTVLNIHNEKVKLASAAMPPVYVFRKASNDVDEYLTGDMPLGALKRQKYDLLELSLNEGDIIVLVSDGLPEMPNPKGELLEYDRVRECIKEHSTKNASEILQALFKLGIDWQAKAVPPEDDVTVVVVKYQ